MPLYEYECLNCGVHYERIQKFSDAPLTQCEKCGGELRKVLSPPAIQFKGTGWYVSDYARKPSPPGESSSTSKSSEGESKDKTAESKPASQPAETTGKKTTS